MIINRDCLRSHCIPGDSSCIIGGCPSGSKNATGKHPGISAHPGFCCIDIACALVTDGGIACNGRHWKCMDVDSIGSGGDSSTAVLVIIVDCERLRPCGSPLYDDGICCVSSGDGSTAYGPGVARH